MQDYHQQNDGTRPMGFAGLAAMVSNVDDIMKEEIKKAKANGNDRPPAPADVATPAYTPAVAPTPQGQPHKITPSNEGNKKGRNWIIGIIVVSVVLWLANRDDRPSAPDYAATPTNSYTPPPAPVEQPAPQLSYVNKVPPMGKNNLLSRAQLRYCLAENIRLDAGRDDLHTKADLKRFNKFVADYNQRCASYRYRKQDLQDATWDVEQRKYEYEAEGRARFQHSRSRSQRTYN